MANTARLDVFGKDLGLIHEVIVTGRKVGAERQFWSRLAHNEELFRQVVGLVQVSGTHLDEGVWFTFRTLGLSIAEQKVRYPGEIHTDDVGFDDPFLTKRGQAGRVLRVRKESLPGSCHRTWEHQQLLLDSKNYVLNSWDLVEAAVAFKEATGDWPNWGWFRTASGRGNWRIVVSVHQGGVGLSYFSDEYRSPGLGLAVGWVPPES